MDVRRAAEKCVREGTMPNRQPRQRRAPRPIDELYLELIRSWSWHLRERGFSDEQVARLTYTKLLYISGDLRD
jgi:hypothetical protein